MFEEDITIYYHSCNEMLHQQIREYTAFNIPYLSPALF